MAGEIPLGSNESCKLDKLVVMSVTGIGNRYLLLTVDVTNLQCEDDDANNFVSAEIERSAPDVDLTVGTFLTPYPRWLWNNRCC